MIRVQNDDFNVQTEYEALVQHANSGATCMFVGRVRDFQSNPTHPNKSHTHKSQSNKKKPFILQHYPGMTEGVLESIKTEANSRWHLNDIRIIHRVGKLAVNDQIVFVGVSSAHREEAFSACQYIMDILKTQAPFWKKEGEHWVEAKKEDNIKAQQWLSQPPLKP